MTESFIHFDLQIAQKLAHVIFCDDAQIGIIKFPVVVKQVMAEKPHFFHHDTAFGKRGLLALRIDDDIRVIDSVIVQSGDHASHGTLPFPAVHDTDHVRNGYACQHGDAGLPAQAVLRLDDNVKAVDFPDRIVEAVRAVLIHVDQAARHVKKDLVLFVNVDVGDIILAQMDLVVSLDLGEQFAFDDLVIQHKVSLNNISLLAHLPDIKGNADAVEIIELVNFAIEEIPHLVTLLYLKWKRFQ